MHFGGKIAPGLNIFCKQNFLLILSCSFCFNQGRHSCPGGLLYTIYLVTERRSQKQTQIGKVQQNCYVISLILVNLYPPNIEYLCPKQGMSLTFLKKSKNINANLGKLGLPRPTTHQISENFMGMWQNLSNLKYLSRL